MLKRLLIGLLALVAGVAPVAAIDSAAPGLWSAAATWVGGVPPLATEDCYALHDVVCDQAVCVCGNMYVYSNVRVGCAEGVTSRVLRIGNATTTTGNTFIIGGQLQMDECAQYEANTDRSDEGGQGLIQVASGGVLSVGGRDIYKGGSVVSATDPSTGNPRKITLTTSVNQPSLDYYNGKVLVARTGWFRSQWFDVTTGATAVNQIVLNADSRGAFDSRNTVNRANPTAWAPGDWGMIYSTGNATVDVDNVTVTFSTPFTSAAIAEQVLLGSRFICSADIGGADFPETNTRRFCSVTDADTAVLCTDYPTASCDAAAAFRVYDDNMPPNAEPPVVAFAAGDVFDIIDQAVMTVVAGSQSQTDQTNNFNITVDGTSTANLKNVEISWCGQMRAGGGAGNIPCLQATGISGSLTTEGFSLDTIDMHHFSGQYGLSIQDSEDLVIRDVVIRDAARNDAANLLGGGATGSGHGFALNDTTTAPEMNDILIDGIRIVGANDDCFSWNDSSTDTILCDGCRVTRATCAFTPSGNGGSQEGFEPIGDLRNFRLDHSTFTNNNGALINFTGTANTLTTAVVDHNVLMNSQTGGIVLGPITIGAGPTAANNRIYFVNNYVKGVPGNIARGHLFSNFIEAATRDVLSVALPVLSFTQSAYGNIILGRKRPLGTNQNACFESVPVTNNTMIGANPIYRDNVCVASRDIPTGATTHYVLGTMGASGVASFSPTLDHMTAVCGDGFNATSTANGLRANLGDTSVVTVTNSVFFDCATAINETAAGSGSDTTSAYNLFLRTVTPKAGVTTISNDVAPANNTAQMDGFRAPFLGDTNMSQGAAARANLGSDGTPRGARVAGPPGGPWALRQVYPFLPDFPVVNNTGAKDKDGDGIWDIHDNCPTEHNPDQRDADGDLAGDRCDRA